MTRRRRPKIEKRPIVSRDEWLAWHKEDITASVVSALWGLHPRETAAGLWAKLTGVDLGPDDENSELLERGQDLEVVVGRKFLHRHPGWKVFAAKHYYRIAALRLGATPDFHVIKPDGKKGVLQAKTVNPSTFRTKWTDETPPMWIMLQTLTEMMLTRSEFGIIAALEIGDFRYRLHTYEVPRHEGAERRIEDAVREFWLHVDAGSEPVIDYQRDSALIAAMYPRHAPDKIADLRYDNSLPGLLDEREALKATLDRAGERKDEIDTELKAKMKDAEIALVNGWRISNKTIDKKEHTVRATSYRQLRVTREQGEAA
jgi:predicted phage-related endonuclease